MRLQATSRPFPRTRAAISSTLRPMRSRRERTRWHSESPWNPACPSRTAGERWTERWGCCSPRSRKRSEFPASSFRAIPTLRDGTGSSSAMRFPVGVVTAIVPFNRPLNQVTVKVAPSFGRREQDHHQAHREGAPVRLPPAQDPSRERCAPRDAQCRDRPSQRNRRGAGGEQERRHGDVHRQHRHRPKAGADGGHQKLTIEAGGNDPLIVCDDGDVDKAVSLAVAGAFGNAGQSLSRESNGCSPWSRWLTSWRRSSPISRRR